jgi:uncharacterized protein YjbI with pentapeptide repeats
MIGLRYIEPCSYVKKISLNLKKILAFWRRRSMANQHHLDILKQGVDIWNQWREDHHALHPDLSEAILTGAHLDGGNFSETNLSGAYLDRTYLNEANLNRARLRRANLSWSGLNGANLSGADLSEAYLNGVYLIEADLTGAYLNGVELSGALLNGAQLNRTQLRKALLVGTVLNGAQLNKADLTGANLTGASLRAADLFEANLSGADLSAADLSAADLRQANLSKVDLSEADLSEAILIRTNLTGVTLTNCRIYGISAWDIQLEGAQQFSLIITPKDQPSITVDNLEVAQFIYLLLNNPKIREAIDTLARKVVLILGSFTLERKEILDVLRDELRRQDYLPVIFDFEKPSSRDLTETVSTLAHLSRFIIVDLTDPHSVPHEIATLVPQCIVPIQPLLLKNGSRREYEMFQDLRKRYHWVLPTIHYQNSNSLLQLLREHVIGPAERKAQELAQR